MTVFAFSPRWYEVAQTWPPLRDPSAAVLVDLLEQRDRDLEDHLARMLSTVDTNHPWVPAITQGVARTSTVNWATYLRIGRWVVGAVKLTATEAGSADFLTVSYPVTPREVDSFLDVGGGYLNATADPLVRVLANPDGFEFATDGATIYATALAVGHVIAFSFGYEAAS